MHLSANKTAELVNDLRWLLSANSDLIVSLPNSLKSDRFTPPPEGVETWLQQLESDSAPLEQAFSQLQSKRLGHYCEMLLAFYLEHGPDRSLTLVHKNLQIFDKGNTVGELDFVYDTHNQRVHLELAVKFYLGFDNRNGELSTAPKEQLWVGPNNLDRLDIKVDRMVNHQLPLGAKIAQPTGANLQSQFMIKGMLFHPAQTRLHLPSTVAPECLQHQWIHATDAMTNTVLDQGSWTALPKNRWLTGFCDAQPALSKAERIDIFQNIYTSKRAVMLEEQVSKRRLMVVNDAWPQQGEKP